MPKTVVNECRKVSFPSQRFQGFAFPDSVVTLDIIKDSGRQHEEASVNAIVISLRLFLEARDEVLVKIQGAEPAWGLGGSQSGGGSLIFMEGDQFLYVDVSNPIPVCQAKIIIIEIGSDPFQSAASHGAVSGAHQSYPPGLGRVLMHFHGVAGDVEGNVRHMQEVIGEIFLEHVTLVAKANDEIVEAMGRIDLHDVPDDRLAADFYHRLGPHERLFADPGAEAASQDYYLQFLHILLRNRGAGSFPGR